MTWSVLTSQKDAYRPVDTRLYPEISGEQPFYSEEWIGRNRDNLDLVYPALTAIGIYVRNYTSWY
jgi:hypothetical protein